MRLLANLKVRTKLILSILPLGLIVLVANFYTSQEMEGIDSRYTELVEHRVKAIMAMTRSNQRIILVNQLLYELIAESDPVSVSRLDAEIEKAIDEHHALVSYANQLDPQQTTRIDEVSQLFDKFLVEAGAVRAKAREQADGEAMKLMRQARPAFSQARMATAALADRMRDNLDAESDTITAETEAVVRFTWMAVVAGLAFTLAMALGISQRGVARPLNRLRDAIRAVASGNHGEAVPCREQKDEIGEIATALEVLRQGEREREAQAFAKAETAAAAETLQSVRDYPAFAAALFSRLRTCLDVVHGELYLANHDEKRLHRVGGFAVTAPEDARSFVFGEGLVGQCAQDARPLEVTSAPDENGVDIRTGLGSLVPKHLLILPMTSKGRCIAVLELACSSPVSERGRLLMDAVLPVAALNLEILSGNLETQALLEKTRMQAESLAVSETQLIARKDELQEALAEVGAVKAQLTEMATSLPVGVYQIVFRPDGSRAITFASPLMEELVGVSPAELMADPMSLWRHVAPDELEKAKPQMKTALERAFAGESLLRGELILRISFGGRERFVLTNAQYRPQKDGTVAASGFVQDVTERKKTEEALNLSNYLSEQALELATAGYWSTDCSDPDHYFSSSRSVALFGEVPREGFRYDLKDEWYNRIAVVDPEIAEATGKHYEAALEGSVPRYDATYPYKRPSDGRVVWIRAIGSVIRDEHGKARFLHGVNQDVTERRLAEQALRKEREKLQNILDASPVGVALSVDGVVRFANPRISEMVDIRAGESVPNTYVNPSDRLRITNELAEKGVVRDLELQMYDPSRQVRDMLVTYMPCEYDGEQGVLGWLLDITERKRIENEVRRAQAEMTQIFNTAAGGMRVIDKNLTVLRANDAYLALTGFSREEVEGHKCFEHFGGEACHGEDCTVERILRGERRIEQTVKRSRKDGREIDLDLTSKPFMSPDGELLGIIEDFRDVTERVAAAKAMEEARVLAEEANQAKSDFLARMSHEIRTPMNAVIGMSHLALQTELTAKQHDYISKIQGSANNLLGIINDILDFSKIEAGRMDIEHIPFDLDETLDNAASVIAVKAEEKGLEVIFDIARDVPRNLVGDPMRLTQVLINYANNAIKFTEKGHVLLSARLEKPLEDGRAVIRFAVTDTGIGLTPEQISRLFQSFSQADGSTTRKYGGTGLGLAICKRLTELMEGEVGVESEPARGSTFWFTVTAGVAKKTDHRAAYVPAVDLRQVRCLVADDNPEMRRILADMLESFSFRVTTVGDGSAALEELARAAKRDPFKLALLDWKMPGLDGNEVARRIKNDPDLNVTQILMVTAFGREEIMREAADSGVSAFLVKPVGASTLFDTIMEVFGQQVERRVRGSKKGAVTPEALKVLRGARVLLAEDNEINQQVATEILNQAGLHVEIASNGREAVDMVEHSAPGYFDVLLMDIQMPEMDGLEAASRIRASDAPGARELPIIAMTAHAMTGDREKSLEAGMNDHVTKPINPEELFEALTRWVKPGERQAPDVPASVDFASPEDDLPLAGLPGLSIKLGLARVGGNRRLYRQLLAKFVAGNLGADADIRKSLDEGDQKTAARLAHTMRSVAANIGAEELSRAGGELERAIKAGDMQVAAGLLAGFAALLAEVLGSIDSLESAAPRADAARPPRAFDPAAMRALLTDLGNLLETDMGQAMTRAEELDALPGAPALAGDLRRLREALGNFDTEEAAQAIGRLLAELEKQ
jgi:PAS domain S-box-containing protein